MDDDDREALANLVAKYGKQAVKRELPKLPDGQPGRPEGAKTVHPQVGLMRAMANRIEEGESVHRAARRVVDETDWPRRAGMRGTYESQARQVVKAWREFEPSIRPQTEQLEKITHMVRGVGAIPQVRVPRVRLPSWVPHVKKFGRFFLHRRGK